MASLAFIGPTVANVAAAAATAYALNAVAGLFPGPKREGRRVSDLRVQTAHEGRGLPIVYGRMRVAGSVIWATRFKESSSTTTVGGGKGGGGGGTRVTEYAYALSLAVAVCEGPVEAIARVWADGRELDLSAITMRVHHGGETQAPDPLIQAVEGADRTPAFRGVAYVVFEDLALADFGDRVPQFSFEVLRAPHAASGEPRLEDLARGVTMIPGAGEFAYATSVVTRYTGPGSAVAENQHAASGGSDFERALDDLAARLPNVESVLLVVAWFGDDLRAGQCQVRPRVDAASKRENPWDWRVHGVERGQAVLVSQVGGHAAYGGTPDDASVIQAIWALKARGYAVGLYPFLLMDVQASEAKPSPWGGTQPDYPWRGRITCDPAPGQSGSADQTAGARTQAEAFFGTAAAGEFAPALTTDSKGRPSYQPGYTGPSAWTWSRMALHYAHLCAAAGGVDSFIIGSEFKALTPVRDDTGAFPAVEALTRLAGEARAALGASTTITYAADWTEYANHRPSDGSNDVLFHLDPLWADPTIDVVGVDWYPPLSDWRDGAEHLDAGYGAAHDRAYLDAHVEGGEAADWFYADQAARDAQARTPISDSAHGEDWIFAAKRLREWWASAHHDRPGGVRSATATAWTPKMKPIWFVEAGCPAVDKGANQPNVFYDPKSSESALPHYSSGARDDLIQRRAIEALLTHWEPAGGLNPLADDASTSMIAWDRIHLWTWDARPFPAFPAREDVWADAGNWARGHWLTGRAGAASLHDVLADLVLRAGVPVSASSGASGVISGYAVEPPIRARDALAQLLELFGVDAAMRGDGVAFLRREAGTGAAIALGDLVLDEDGRRLERMREDPADAPDAVRLTFFDDPRDQQAGAALASVTQQAGAVDARRELHVEANVALDHASAGLLAEDLLADARARRETARVTLPPSRLDVEAGDVVRLGADAHVYRVMRVEEDGRREAELTRIATRRLMTAGPTPGVIADVPAALSAPAAAILDLPATPWPGVGGVSFAAFAHPWPGAVVLGAGLDAASVKETARADQAAGAVETLTALAAGPVGRFDHAASLDVAVWGRDLSSTTQAGLFAGANRLALEASPGRWILLQFLSAELIGVGQYRLRGLLRAEGDPIAPQTAGFVLDEAVDALDWPASWRGASVAARATAPGLTFSSETAWAGSVTVTPQALVPPAPAHVRAERQPDGAVRLSWMACVRADVDDWGPGAPDAGQDRDRWRVELLDAADTTLSTYESPSETLDVTSAQEVVAYGASPHGAWRVRVARWSDAVGWGEAATTDLTLG